MDNPLKRITAVLCTTFLLSGCHSDIQQTQAKEDTTLQQETQEVSLQLQDEPLITEEFEYTDLCRYRRFAGGTKRAD